MNIENLKMARKLSGMTQKQVADELGISRNTYKNYEQGTREPNGDTIVALAEKFNTSTDFLLGKPKSSPPADPIVELCTKYNFGMIERAIITAYCAMDEKQRKNFMGQIGQFSEKVHNACLEAVQTVPDEHPEESTQPIMQEQAMQEVANNTEQIADETQVDVATVQEVSTDENTAEQNPVEAVAKEDETQSDTAQEITASEEFPQKQGMESIQPILKSNRHVNIQETALYPSQKIAREGGAPSVDMFTKEEVEEYISRPRADDDM